MAIWELMRDAVEAAHRRGKEWLKASEIVQEVKLVEPAVNDGTVQALGRAYCINDPLKRHWPGLYRRNPLLVTDDPTMRGKRYRLLTKDERKSFLSRPRDDLETVSYAQLMDWLANPESPLESQVSDEAETEQAALGVEAVGPALLELHLQDYIFRHWKAIFPDLELFRGTKGREFRTYDPSVGIIDFLCTDSNADFVVIETKRELPDRQALGQMLGYMGWVSEKVCGEGQHVRGILVASEATDQLRLAAKAVPNLQLYRYEISFDVRPC